MKTIKIKPGLIEGKERLKLYFSYDREVIELIKTIPGARWHPREKCWHVSVLAGPVDKLNRLFEGKLLFEIGKENGEPGEEGKGGRGEGVKSGDRANSRSMPSSFTTSRYWGGRCGRIISSGRRSRRYCRMC